MIKEEDFIAFLKSKGKSENVIDLMLSGVASFERFLLDSNEKSIEEAEKEDIEGFAKSNYNDKARLKQQLRSIAQYFCFLSEPSLAKYASELREKEIAAKRKGMRLDRFSGYDRTIVEKLAKEGIFYTYQMIAAARSPELRESLAARTGIEMERILEYLKLSDLSRLGGMKGVRARLYYDAGVDTLDKLSNWNPEELRTMLVDFVRKTGFKGIPPLPKEVSSTIEAAKKLERLVDF